MRGRRQLCRMAIFQNKGSEGINKYQITVNVLLFCLRSVFYCVKAVRSCRKSDRCRISGQSMVSYATHKECPRSFRGNDIKM